LPISFLNLTVGAKPFTFTVSQSILVEAPIRSLMVDIPTPSMVNIVFELTFVQEIVNLTSQSLHFASFIYLPKSLFVRVLSNPHVIVYCCISIPDNISSIQDTILSPPLHHGIKVLIVAKCWNSIVILRLCLEFVC
jgi:hypothetical protein